MASDDKLSGPEPIVTPGKKTITLEEPPDSFTPITSVPGKNQPLAFPKGPSQPLTDDAIGQAMNYIRPFISGAAGTAGSFLPMGAVAGPAAYTATDLAQKYLNPTQKPESGVEAFSDSALEGIKNEVAGRILGGVFGTIGKIRNAGVPDPNSILKLYPTTSQALENYGYHKLATASQFMEDYGAPAAKAAALDRAGGEGFTQALFLSNRMNSGGRFTKNVFQDPTVLKQKILDTLDKGINKQATPGQFQSPIHYASDEAYNLLNGGATPFESLDNVINNKDKLDKVLSVGQAVGPKNLNVRKDLQAYYWNRIFDEATTTIPGGGARIDPQKINDLWFNPKSGELTKNLETLYGKGTKGDLDKFMKNVIDAQSGTPGTGLLNRAKYLGGGFGIGGGLLSTMLGHTAAGAITSGLYLTNGVMGRLLTNPAVGKAVIDSLTGNAPTLGSKLLARGVFSALEGSRVALLDNQQKKTWGNIVRQPDGSYQFVQE